MVGDCNQRCLESSVLGPPSSEKPSCGSYRRTFPRMIRGPRPEDRGLERPPQRLCAGSRIGESGIVKIAWSGERRDAYDQRSARPAGKRASLPPVRSEQDDRERSLSQVPQQTSLAHARGARKHPVKRRMDRRPRHAGRGKLLQRTFPVDQKLRRREKALATSARSCARPSPGASLASLDAVPATSTFAVPPFNVSLQTAPSVASR